MTEQVTFNINNFHQQNFPYSQKQIKYILENSNASLIQKLYRTCKYFYLKLPYFIVDSLDFNISKGRFENKKYDGCMDVFWWKDLETIDNIWITKEFNINSALTFCHILYPKIARCTAKKVELSFIWWAKEILEKDLSQAGTIEELICDYLIPKDEVKIEDILALVPNVKRITYRHGHVTPETMPKLLSIPWKHKLEKFYLEKLDGPVDPELYHKFIKAHVAKNSETKIGFKFENYKIFEKNFKQAYKSIIIDEEKDSESSEEYEPNEKKLKLFIYEEEQEESASKVEINYNQTQGQSFPFCSTIMKYVLQNGNGKIIRKFSQTCKYFKNKSKFVIIDEIRIDEDDGIIMIVDNEEYEFKTVKELLDLFPSNNIWITKSFKFDIDEKDDELSELIKKIARCDVENVQIRFNGILEREFQVFCKSKNLIRWHSNFAPIYDEENEDYALVENLMPNLINATEIAFHKCLFTPQTFDKLLSLPWKNQIKVLWFTEIEYPIDSEEFFQFLKVSIAPRAYVKVVFDEIINEEYPEIFEKAIKAKLVSWMPKCEKPSFLVSYFEDSTMV